MLDSFLRFESTFTIYPHYHFKAVSVPTVLHLQNEIYLFAGANTADVQKMSWNSGEQTIENVEILYQQPQEKIFNPIVFESLSGKCKAKDMKMILI
jgi:hypothetical protein